MVIVVLLLLLLVAVIVFVMGDCEWMKWIKMLLKPFVADTERVIFFSNVI